MSTLIPSPYQLLHLMKLRSNQQNALLIADGVGVGKTISSGYIIYHQAVISKRSVLIVCPPILVEKWRNEMKTKFTIDIRLANKKDTFDLMVDEVNSRTSWENGPIYITTFSLLSRLSDINSPSFGLLVMDEVHAARNPNIRLYPILKEISQNSEFRVGLSATPINNSVSDLASILSLLMPRYSFQELNSLMEDTWGLPMVRSMSSITTRFTKDQVAHHFTIRDIHNVEIEYPPEYISFVRGKISEKYPWASGFQLETISMHRLAASSPPE